MSFSCSTSRWASSKGGWVLVGPESWGDEVVNKEELPVVGDEVVITKISRSLENEVVHNEELPVVGSEVVNNEDSRLLLNLKTSRVADRV